MSTDLERRAAAEDLICREALYLDERRWEDWLALFDEDAVFWVPAWKDESEPTGDPDTEISLIYTASRRRLEERVERVVSGKSVASFVLPRTAHAISNVTVEPGAENGAMTVKSICTTNLFDPKRRLQHQSFARYEHQLVESGGTWRIARKRVLLLNDSLPTMLDYYTV